MLSLRSFFAVTLLSAILLAVAAFAGGKKHTKRHTRTADTPGEQMIEPRTINVSKIGAPGLQLKEPFSKNEALRKLIPGNYYVFEDDYNKGGLHLVSWACKGCRTHKIVGLILQDTVDFPMDANLTEPGDVLRFTDDSGRQNIIFSFATHEHQISPDELHYGRFTGVYLGLARFVLYEKQWVLKNFTNGIGCYGMFQYLPEIHLIKLGRNNYGCYLLDGSGGPGQVIYNDLHVFGLVNGRFKTILNVNGAGRTNTPSSNWQMKLRSNTADTGFSPLQLTIAGDLNKKGYDFTDDTTANAPCELYKTIATTDSFNFKVTRQYFFKNGRYIQSGHGKVSLH